MHGFVAMKGVANVASAVDVCSWLLMSTLLVMLAVQMPSPILMAAAVYIHVIHAPQKHDVSADLAIITVMLPLWANFMPWLLISCLG